MEVSARLSERVRGHDQVVQELDSRLKKEILESSEARLVSARDVEAEGRKVRELEKLVTQEKERYAEAMMEERS